MSRSLTEKSETRLRSFSAPRIKTPVSQLTSNGLAWTSVLMSTDVIVLTSMGEEVAIDAKEAPRS